MSLRDGYVFDRVSGFHWHPYASHWFQPSMGIFLSPKGDLLDAADARHAALAAMDGVVSAPAAVAFRPDESLPEVEIGLADDTADDDSFDLPSLSIDHEELAAPAIERPIREGGFEAGAMALPAVGMSAPPGPIASGVWTAASASVPPAGSEESRPNVAPASRAAASTDRLDPAEIPARFAEAWRVVIHLRSGSSKRGEMKGGDLHSRSLVLHHASGADPVDTESIKAIFFMREANATAQRPTGSRVRITFADGRPLEGFAPRKLPSSGGFFVLPADDRTNTAWIFVYPHAIKDLAFG